MTSNISKYREFCQISRSRLPAVNRRDPPRGGVVAGRQALQQHLLAIPVGGAA